MTDTNIVNNYVKVTWTEAPIDGDAKSRKLIFSELFTFNDSMRVQTERAVEQAKAKMKELRNERKGSTMSVWRAVRGVEASVVGESW